MRVTLSRTVPLRFMWGATDEAPLPLAKQISSGSRSWGLESRLARGSQKLNQARRRVVVGEECTPRPDALRAGVRMLTIAVMVVSGWTLVHDYRRPDLNDWYAGLHRKGLSFGCVDLEP